MQARRTCEYFTEYGNAGIPGTCFADATLMLDSRNIIVCQDHADSICERFPALGDVAQRFTRFQPRP